ERPAMRRWIPHPLVALAMFIMWLLLTQSFSLGQIVLAAIAAFLGSWGMAALRQEPLRVRGVGAALTLAWTVFVDIIRSNFAVASIVLFPRRDQVAGFVHLPLDLREPRGLAILGLIITATPGTIWVQLARAQNILIVHLLALVGRDEGIAVIKDACQGLALEVCESA